MFVHAKDELFLLPQVLSRHYDRYEPEAFEGWYVFTDRAATGSPGGCVGMDGFQYGPGMQGHSSCREEANLSEAEIRGGYESGSAQSEWQC